MDGHHPESDGAVMGPALSTDSPHCEETEQLLLGAILVENNVLNKVGDVIKVEHFFCSIHRNIYDAIIKLIEQGRVVTPLSLSPYLQSDPELEAVGGISYLADLAAAVVTPLQALDHALIIRDHWVRRSVLELATAACQQIKVPTPDVSVYDVIAGIERDLSALNDCNDKRFEPVELERACAQAIEAVDAAMKRGDAITGITTGLRDLDWRISGLAKGELIVLAGRPAIGFAKGYLDNVSPNMVRDLFAEASYKALTEPRTNEAGEEVKGAKGAFLRIIDSEVNRSVLLDVFHDILI